MIRYTWTTGSLKSHELYIETVDNSNNATAPVHINFKVVSIPDHNSQKTWCLFTPEGEHVDIFYKYINHDLKERGCSPNTIKMHAYIIKVFFIFLYIMRLNYTQIDRYAKKELVSFLRSIPRTNNSTLRIYLSTIRSFLSSLGIEDGAMFKKNIVRTSVPITSNFGFSMSQGRYDEELPRTNSVDVLPPKHITPWEFSRLMVYLADKKETKFLLLVLLGYFYGARAGECLGMTWEDVILNTDTPRILLRNRLSDRIDQRAKNKMTPKSREDYYSYQYTSETESVYGYIPLHVNPNLLIVLNNYMSAEKQRIAAHPKQYASNIADTISSSFVGPDGSNRNYYLFSAKNGASLNYSCLNYWIKKFFTAVNIPTINGTFHKLRHGCGMLHSFYLVPPVERQQLMLIMRHKTITSSEVYTRVPEPELMKRRTILQERILHEIPELNLSLDSFL